LRPDSREGREEPERGRMETKALNNTTRALNDIRLYEKKN
jgi:hypothetical protein